MTDFDPFAGFERPPAPPYRGEGRHALWHFSENPDIEVFRPQPVAVTSEPENEYFVWAVDTRHAPMFWFPRDCPRGCAWASDRTTPADRERFFPRAETPRIHVIEGAWLDRMRDCRLYMYELPPDTFEPHSVGGYWCSRETVVPLRRLEVGDLLGRHADAGIELRIAPSIWPWWAQVIHSTLEFSGSRLRNCTVPEPDWVRLGPK